MILMILMILIILIILMILIILITHPIPMQQQQSLTQHKSIQKQLINGIPEHILTNPILKASLQLLPSHYNFQLPKTIHRINTVATQLSLSRMRVSLQFPEGLMMFACLIADVLKACAQIPVEIIIMGDVTYGACCVEDIASTQMRCDLLVHYGHSCLVPVTQTKGRVMYVFVQIQVDVDHFIDTICFNFSEDKTKMLYLMSTIQFNNSLFLAKTRLVEMGFTNIVIPQQKPRSAGEVLGCTAPCLPLSPQDKPVVVFLCDGRFHMQAAMISNPNHTFYQYDPYTRQITEERYQNDQMRKRRQMEIEKAKNGQSKRLCFIFGALGRQGNRGILHRLEERVKGVYSTMTLIASEVNSDLLQGIPVDFFVQIACPRLSIDWADSPKPLLTPFELFALMDSIDVTIAKYSMDYYSWEGGPWSNFYGKAPVKKQKKAKPGQAKIKLEIQKECKSEKCENCSCKNSKQEEGKVGQKI